MKYHVNDQVIPQSKRAEINNKILALIDMGKAEENGINQETIFNAYTGDGGLHGLSRTDFANYHEFSETKKDIEQGAFFTPPSLASYLMDCLKPSESDLICDFSSGSGVFCNYAPVESNFHGNEINANYVKISRHLYPTANFSCGDMRNYEPEVKFDIVVGNPPFGLDMGDYASEMFYLLKAYEILRPGGICAVITPQSFLSDDFSNSGAITLINEKYSYMGQITTSNTAFKYVGVDNFATKLIFLQKRSESLPFIPFEVKKIYAMSIAPAELFYRGYVEPAKIQAEAIKKQLAMEIHRQEQSAPNLLYDIQKMLYHIKAHPKTISKYGKCLAYYEKYLNQSQPPNMPYEEWQKHKITPKKVIAYLKRVLKEQNSPTPRDIIRLVKTDYGLKLKAYSGKSKALLNKMTGPKVANLNDLVIENFYSFEDNAYKKLVAKKNNSYEVQRMPIADRPINLDIDKFLSTFKIYDKENDEIIKLNDVQKRDTNRLLQSPYGFLQWEQGSGKTLSAITQAMYRMTEQNAKFTIIIAPAIAINNNWQPCLESYGFQFVKVNKLVDLNKIMPNKEQFVLLTFNAVCKYKKQLTKFMKIYTQKSFVVIDESDSLSSSTSKRTRATLAAFRRAKYKLCMTGTSTRNHIAESATQFEFLYNNSVNMLSENEYIVVKNKNGEEEEQENPYYMQPIPAFTKGYKLFKQSHLPEKITVFGVEKHTQDIYNANALKSLIDRTIVTRTFEEVSGRKIHEIHQSTVQFNGSEALLMSQIVNEFYSMKHLFSSTGNTRKDRMLEIVQQLNLMLKACVMPECFKEYTGTFISEKLQRVLMMCYNWENEYIAIGLRHIDSVSHYAKIIKQKFPDREIFIVTGKSMTLKQRKSMVSNYRNSQNGILVCTQQSLSSSMNIGFVNKVIVPELAWNEASMSQWYMRFVRYNSTKQKDIYYLTYENSIESNLLSLIMAKEKLNLFMKNNAIEDFEIYEKFGVNFNLIEMLLTKIKDPQGNIHINWAKQKIV